jgi:RNA polymerase sigma-70 factor (ECF subfamily)
MQKDVTWPPGQADDREEWFRSAFEQYFSVVSAYFSRKGCSREEGSELAQEVFLRVYKSMDSFRGDSSFEAWLYQISANLYRNTVRAQSTRKRDGAEVSLAQIIEDADPENESPWLEADDSPLAELLAGERSTVLREALQELPAQMRRCVILRIDQDLKYREIASLMRISIETVKAHLFQARQILKSRLEPYLDPRPSD